VTPAERAAALGTAARLVRGVVAELNDHARRCEHCGLTVKEEFTEAKAKVQLEAVANRIEAWRATLAKETQP
jgi:hypothetical protein